MPRSEKIKQGLIKTICLDRWQITLTYITKTFERARHPFIGELNLRNTRTWNQFTYRADGSIINKQDRQAPEAIKHLPRELYSSKTSTSFFNAEQNLYPTPFRSRYTDLPSAGLLFTTDFDEDKSHLHSDSVIIDRCYKRDCGTYHRPFDARSKTEAQEHLSRDTQSGNFVRSPLSIAKNNTNLSATNEVLAQLRWKNNAEARSPACYVAIFNDTPITATAALIYAEDLKTQLKAVQGIDEEIRFASYDNKNNQATLIEKSLLVERATAYCDQDQATEYNQQVKLLYQILNGEKLSKANWEIVSPTIRIVLCIPLQEKLINDAINNTLLGENESRLPTLCNYSCATTKTQKDKIEQSKEPLVLWPYRGENFDIENFAGIDFSERPIFASANFDLRTLRKKNIRSNQPKEYLDGFMIRLPAELDFSYFHGLPMKTSFSYKSMKQLLKRLPRELAKPDPKEQQAYQALRNLLHSQLRGFFPAQLDTTHAGLPAAKNVFIRSFRFAKLLLLLEQLSKAETHKPITRKHLNIIAATGLNPITYDQAELTIFFFWNLSACLLLAPSFLLKDKSNAVSNNFIIMVATFTVSCLRLIACIFIAKQYAHNYIYANKTTHQHVTNYLEASKQRTLQDDREYSIEQLMLLMSEIEHNKRIRSLVTGIRVLFNQRKPCQQFNFLALSLFDLSRLFFIAVAPYTNLLNPIFNAIIAVADLVVSFALQMKDSRNTNPMFCYTETELDKLNAETLLPKNLVRKIRRTTKLKGGNNSVHQIQQALENQIETLSTTIPDLEQGRRREARAYSITSQEVGAYDGEKEYKGVEGNGIREPLLGRR